MTVTYHLTVTDWTQRRGYRNSGRGWRVRLFSLPDDDWNALAYTIEEQFFRTEAAARKRASELAAEYRIAVTA